MNHILFILSYALHCMHCSVCPIFSAMYSMPCILCNEIHSLYFMLSILCIVFYALYTMHCIFETRYWQTNEHTERQTDVVRYRAAIAAKNYKYRVAI